MKLFCYTIYKVNEVISKRYTMSVIKLKSYTNSFFTETYK